MTKRLFTSGSISISDVCFHDLTRDEQRLEDELQITIHPGTEIMTDVGSHHFVRQPGASSTVLVPQPSSDPHDPLFNAIFWATASSFLMGLGPLSVSPMFGYLEEEFDRSLFDVVQLTGVAILVLGFSKFFWVPIADTFGRLPVLVFSAIICLGSKVWRSVATSYTSFLGACALNGFSAGTRETLAPQVITDVLFLHSRGLFTTILFSLFTSIGPIISGVMALHVGWRSFWWLNVAGCALLIVGGIFLFPETKWDRVQPNEQNAPPSTNTAQGAQVNQVNTEKKVAVQEENSHSEVATNSPDGAFDPFLHKGHPSKGQFNFYQIGNDWVKSLWLAFWVPWQMHLFPIVHFSAFAVSWSSSVFLTVNLIQSQFLGVIIGLATNGPLSDWASMRATKKNGGIREPEMRLPTLIPYVIIAILGNFIVAFGYEYKWDWRVIVIIGYTCAGIQVAALPAITSTYAVDSYKPVVGSIFVAITVNKNLWGYGFSKFITPWTEKAGYLPVIMTNICLTTLWCSFGFVFYFAGKNYFRRWTANSNICNLQNN
ncbi:MFS transporter [Penicillium malachiteum]|nr:MFS transporter [Penicillium malachiteum]